MRQRRYRVLVLALQMVRATGCDKGEAKGSDYDYFLYEAVDGRQTGSARADDGRVPAPAAQVADS